MYLRQAESPDQRGHHHGGEGVGHGGEGVGGGGKGVGGGGEGIGGGGGEGAAGGGGAGGAGGGEVVQCLGALPDVLEEEVPLVLRGLAVLGPHDAGGPVEVEHVDQLLLLLLELFDLGLEVRVDALQLLWLLEEGGGGIGGGERVG